MGGIGSGARPGQGAGIKRGPRGPYKMRKDKGQKRGSYKLSGKPRKPSESKWGTSARDNPLAYISWHAMRARCRPGHKDYMLYGGRGIKICDRWNDRLNQHAFGDHLRPASAVTGRLKSFRFSRV